MEQSAREAAIQHAAKLFADVLELQGLPVPQYVFDADTYYAHASNVIPTFCTHLEAMSDDELDVLLYSDARDRRRRAIADWWEKHQEADRKREARLDDERMLQQIRASGRAKLTADERKALGLESGSEGTTTELEAKYGPNWRAVDVVVQKVARATQEQIGRLGAGRDSAWTVAQDVALDAADAGVLACGRLSAWNAAGTAALRAVRSPGGIVALDATWSAVRPATAAATAVVMKDLIGQHGFTQEHYDTMTRAWLEVFGDPLEAPFLGKV